MSSVDFRQNSDLARNKREHKERKMWEDIFNTHLSSLFNMYNCLSKYYTLYHSSYYTHSNTHTNGGKAVNTLFRFLYFI